MLCKFIVFILFFPFVFNIFFIYDSEEDYCLDDGRSHTPKEIYSYLGRVLYSQRNKMDPLWNTLVVAGLEGEAP